MMRRVVVIAGLGAALLAAEVVYADTVGRLIYAQGRAQMVRNLKAQRLIPGSPIEENDTMRVQIGARMKTILSDDSILMIWEDTEIRLETAEIDMIQGKRVIGIEQLTGNLRVIASEFLASSNEIQIRTPNARITLDGAGDVVVRQGVQGDNTEIIAISGIANVEHIFADYGGQIRLEPQQTTIVGVERAPSEPVFMDRDAFDDLVDGLLWTLPEPVPDWDDYLGERLETYGVRAFGRVRRLAAKPMTPIHTVVEGLSESNLPARPGNPLPEPRGVVNIDWDFENVQE